MQRQLPDANKFHHRQMSVLPVSYVAYSGCVFVWYRLRMPHIGHGGLRWRCAGMCRGNAAAWRTSCRCGMLQVWLKCSRSTALARHLREQRADGMSRPLIRSLPAHVTDLLSILTHGSPSLHFKEPLPRCASRDSKEASHMWLEACSTLDIPMVEKLRPLLQTRLASATTVSKEALSRYLQDFTATRLSRWGGCRRRKSCEAAAEPAVQHV